MANWIHLSTFLHYVLCLLLFFAFAVCVGFFYFVTLLKIRWQTTVALFRYIVFVTCITKMPFFSLQLGLIINDNKKCPTLYKCSDNFNRYPKAFVIKIQPLLWLCLIVFPICIQSRRVCEVLTSQTIAVCTWQYHTERRSKELISSLLKLLFPPLVKSCCFMVQHRQGGKRHHQRRRKGASASRVSARIMDCWAAAKFIVGFKRDVNVCAFGR